MYMRHFGLTSIPFRITPDTRWFFGGGQRAEILETLKYAIRSGAGIIKITGEIGTGKTMLCRMLEEQLPENIETVYLANPSLGKNEIVAAICHELGIQPTDSGLENQRRLYDYLISSLEQSRQVVVFIEEAQQMPPETLEAVRLLSNLETRQHKLLQLALFAQPELDQLLATHEMRQLRDRITHSFRLKALGANDVRNYLRFRLHNAGYQGNDPFGPLACRLLTYHSRGLIRRLHILADKALLAAYADHAPQATVKHVLRACRDHDLESSKRLPRRPALAAGLALVLTAALLVGPLHPVPGLPGPDADSQQPAAERRIIDDLSMAKPGKEISTAIPQSLIEQRLRASRDWLTRTHRDHLTIQLLLSDNDDLGILEKLLEIPLYRNLLGDLYLVRSTIGGRDRWNLLYGEFDSRTKALAALAELPDRIRKHKPYLRSLKGLRQQRTIASVAPEDGQG